MPAAIAGGRAQKSKNFISTSFDIPPRGKVYGDYEFLRRLTRLFEYRQAEIKNKAIITVLGADKKGIIAAVSGYLAKNDINILDISQTIMANIFTMITMVDISEATKPFDEIYDDLKKLGDELGVVIQIQLAEVFDAMHRI